MCTCKFKVYSDKQIKQCGKYNIEQEQQSEPKLIPFNLEKALSGEEVIFRNSKKVEEVLYSKKMNRVIIRQETGDFWTSFHYPDGMYMRNSESDNDLFMAPKPKETRWVNVYKNQGETVLAYHTFSSKISCENFKYSDMLCNPIGLMVHLKTISFEV